MKVRIYCPWFPYPVTEGAFQVIFDQARALAKQGHRLEIVTWKESHGSLTRKLKEFSKLPWAKQVKSVSVAESSKESAPRRLARTLRSLATPYASPEIFHYPPSADPIIHDKAGDETDLGIYHFSFSYVWLKRRAARHQPRSEKKTVVHFHNLESEQALARSKAEGEGLGRLEATLLRPIHLLNAEKLRRHEAELGHLADELWFVSPRDIEFREYGAQATPGANAIARLVPPGYDPSLREKRQPAQTAERKNLKILGFLGSLDFGPNQDSANWIVNDLAPALAARSFAGKIHIAGRSPSAGLINEAKQYPFIDVLGFLPEVEPFWTGLSFLLIPHITGSGVRTKLLESLASGIPALTHPAALDQLDPALRKNPLLHSASTAKQWADIIMESGPFELRDQGWSDQLPQSLNGDAIYSFLESTH